VVKPVVKSKICGEFPREKKQKSQCLQGFLGLWENEKTGTACTLPKQARYQLRYISIIK